MKLAAAKLFGSLEPNNLGVTVDKSANFFQRLFPNGGTRLIAEGNQSHDEDWPDAIGRPVSARREHTISSNENCCAGRSSSARFRPQSYMREIAALREPRAYRFRRALVSLDPTI